MLAYPAGVGEDSILELHMSTDIDAWILVQAEIRNANARRVGEVYVRRGRDEEVSYTQQSSEYFESSVR